MRPPRTSQRSLECARACEGVYGPRVRGARGGFAPPPSDAACPRSAAWVVCVMPCRVAGVWVPAVCPNRRSAAVGFRDWAACRGVRCGGAVDRDSAPHRCQCATSRLPVWCIWQPRTRFARRAALVVTRALPSPREHMRMPVDRHVWHGTLHRRTGRRTRVPRPPSPFARGRRPVCSRFPRARRLIKPSSLQQPRPTACSLAKQPVIPHRVRN